MASNALITLDYTLCDLYRLDNKGTSLPILIFHRLAAKAHQTTLPTKFIYHPDLKTTDTTIEQGLIDLELRTLPQRYGFSAGRMPLIMPKFDADYGSVSKADPSYQADAYNTFTKLRRDQQPIVRFSMNPIYMAPSDVIAVAEPSDFLSHLPHLVDPEMHYEILSKRGLALSGLPTPSSTVIDPLIRPEHVQDDAQLKQEITRMTQVIDTRRAPFVVKLSQSFSSRGVFEVSSDDEKAQVKEILSNQLRVTLAKLNPTNHHLYPSSLVLQDYIAGTTMALSLFVTQKGRLIFIACCKQQFNKQGHWAGASISYANQASLHKMYAQTMEKVAQFLHCKGYHGPAGVDIITNTSGQQFIVDINARVTGSYHLGPLAGHFLQRGLSMAAAITGYFPCSRTAFEGAFAVEIWQGALVITGWLYEDSMQMSYGSITVAGRDSSAMEMVLVKVRSFSFSP